MLKLKKLALAASVACLGLGAAPIAQAVPVTGELHITGALSLSSSGIDFLPGAGGNGSFSVVGGTGSFASLVGSTGTVKDVAVGAPVQSSLLTFAADPLLHFDSTALFAGVHGAAGCSAAPAAGQSCTPLGIGANLTNLSPTMSTLSIAGSGNFVHGTDSSPYFGTMTTQFAGQSFQSVIATLGAGGSVTTSYSASLVPVPEPGGIVLMLAGLIAIALFSRQGGDRS